MTDTPQVAQRTCPECGAELTPTARNCWLCRRATQNGDEIILAELANKPPPYVSMKGWWIGLAVILFIVAAGSFFVAPGLGILLLVVEIVVMLVIFSARAYDAGDTESNRRQEVDAAYASPSAEALERDKTLPPFTPKTNVARQVLVTLGVVFLVTFSAFIAFCIFCFALIISISP